MSLETMSSTAACSRLTDEPPSVPELSMGKKHNWPGSLMWSRLKLPFCHHLYHPLSGQSSRSQ